MVMFESLKNPGTPEEPSQHSLFSPCFCLFVKEDLRCFRALFLYCLVERTEVKKCMHYKGGFCFIGAPLPTDMKQLEKSGNTWFQLLPTGQFN